MSRPLRCPLGRAPVCALVLCLLLLVAGLGALPGGARASGSCWQQVISDWSDNGRIDRMYPATCYRQALTNLPEDLESYSSAPDDIQRALLGRRPGARVRVVAGPVDVRPATPGAGGGLAVAIVAAGAGALAVSTAGYILWRRPRRGS